MRECISHHYACDCREEMFARAIQIADEAMIEMLQSHALQADEHGVSWALRNGYGDDVATLYEADKPLIDAVEWLLERKLCKLVESPHGAVVLLLPEIEECVKC